MDLLFEWDANKAKAHLNKHKVSFRGKKGVRGKYYRAYRRGHAVKVHEADGSVTVQYFTLAEGAIMLEPDVRAYFPDSGAVNKALRSLIALAPVRPVERKSLRSRRVGVRT
jgi:hypothetical protein